MTENKNKTPRPTRATRKQQFEKVLENALLAFEERAQARLGQASAERHRLLTTDGKEITVTKEWLTRFAEAHIDLGAASAVLHVCRSLQNLFDLGDPFAELVSDGEKDSDFGGEDEDEKGNDSDGKGDTE